MIDYYKVLGVPRNASKDLIKKTYAALSKIYHPDIYMGDKHFANEKTQEINQAYSVLSSVQKRKEYDEELKRSSSQDYGDNGFDTEFDDDFDTKAEETYSSIIKKDWEFACTYYPELRETYSNLRKLNRTISLQFQVILVSDKSFADYLSVALKLENDYLASKFGPNTMVQALARDAILTENVGFAKDLNKALKVLGHKSDEKVLENLCVKYRTFASQYYRNYGFQRIINKVDGDNSKYNEKKKDPKEPEEENTNSHKMFYFNEINPLVWLLGIPIGALLISLLIGSTVVKFLE